MSEMVERVAKAICWSERPSRWPKCPCESNCTYELNSAVSEPKARAAIAAMRDPSATIFAAGVSAESKPENGLLEAWQAMIDEALK